MRTRSFYKGEKQDEESVSKKTQENVRLRNSKTSLDQFS